MPRGSTGSLPLLLPLFVLQPVFAPTIGPAYFWWACGGLFGAHRFYLGRKKSGGFSNRNMLFYSLSRIRLPRDGRAVWSRVGSRLFLDAFPCGPAELRKKGTSKQRGLGDERRVPPHSHCRFLDYKGFKSHKTNFKLELLRGCVMCQVSFFSIVGYCLRQLVRIHAKKKI